MAGTLIAYQGFVASDVVFRRSRGYRSDTTIVILPLDAFPAGFDLSTPRPGDLAKPVNRVLPDIAMIRQGSSAAPVQQRSFLWAGTLVMAEQDAELWQVVVHPMYVLRVETVSASEDGSAFVQVVLGDQRHFWPRGFMDRWSFNRRRADGELALDSVKDDGSLFKLWEIAERAVRRLHRTPSLQRWPKGNPNWDASPGFEFPPFAAAIEALGRIVTERGLEDPVLTLEGGVALWEPGEGRVGYAPEGVGPENRADLPAAVRVWEDGHGTTHHLEQGYPEDYVLVVGGPRVQTVELDEWEPVLVLPKGLTKSRKGVELEGELALTEDLVRDLTGGLHGLEWLYRFVLASQAYQHFPGVRPEVVTLLREQALRLYRMPGAVREDGSPGPNAHLLPLQPRAETEGGRRAPVQIECHRFTVEHRAVRTGSAEDAKVAAAREALDQIRSEIQRVARQRGLPDPFRGPVQVEGPFPLVPEDDAFTESLAPLDRLIDGLLLPGLGRLGSDEELAAAVRHADLIERIRAQDSAFASAYESTYKDLLKAQDEGSGGASSEIHQVGSRIAELRRRAIADTNALDDSPLEEAIGGAAFAGLRAQIRAELEEANRAAERRRVEAEQRSRVGAGPAPGTPQAAVLLKNLPRTLDRRGGVYDAQRGIIRTGVLAVHVADEGVPMASATNAVPKPVLVRFGAHVRPRIDVPPGQAQRPTTGPTRPRGPAAADDRESVYCAAFRRGEGAGGFDRVDVKEVPAGEGFVVRRPDLVELVPLGASEGNLAELDAQAEQIAADLFRRPALIRSTRFTLAGPWPINPDGLVAEVEIRSEQVDGAPCGFTTTIVTGSRVPALNPLQTRTKPRFVPFGQDAAVRGGLLP